MFGGGGGGGPGPPPPPPPHPKYATGRTLNCVGPEADLIYVKHVKRLKPLFQSSQKLGRSSLLVLASN